MAQAPRAWIGEWHVVRVMARAPGMVYI